jgi:hypothetical protein
LTLTAADLGEPAALASLKALVTNGSAAVIRAAGGGGPAPFATPAPAPLAGLQLWSAAQAAPGQAGAYSVTVAPAAGGASVAAQQAAVSASETEFPFLVSVSTGGNYDVSLSDLEFPAGFISLSYTLYQNAAKIGQGSASHTATQTPIKSGLAVLAVNAATQPGGSGLFAAAIEPTGGGQALFDTTQAVSESFLTQDIVVTNAASYDFTLTDLQWPDAFSTLDVVITQNGKNVAAGKIYGGGTFTLPNVAPGRYVATILAVPAAGQTAGLFNLSTQASRPTATLTASPTTIPSGQGVTLTWSSTNATSCSGTGGWTKSLAPSGTMAEGPLSATTTYTLSCTGTSGTSAPTSVTVKVSSSSGGGGGGGGGSWGLVELALLALYGRRRVRTLAARVAGALHSYEWRKNSAAV